VGFSRTPFARCSSGAASGDVVGRKYAFLVTLTYGFFHFCIGLDAVVATAGWFPPIVLILIRVLQVLALGGEYGRAVVYVAENVPTTSAAFYTSFIQITATPACVLAHQSRYANSMSKKTRGLRLRNPFLISIILGASLSTSA